MRTLGKLSFAISACLILCTPLRGWAAPSTLFHFRNGFWINLHHFLYAEALAQAKSGNARWISSSQAAVKLAPCEAFSSSQAKQGWDNAVKFYSGNYASRDMLFDHDFAHFNDLLGEAADGKELPDELPADLKSALQQAAPAYRESCWPNHRKLNQAWIDSLRPLLEAHGQDMADRLTKIFDTQWPAQPIPADVVVYANWAGAYTVSSPPHITVGSVGDDPGDAQLEVIFHEALHTMDQNMDRDLTAAFSADHAEMPRNFDHVVIFFTAGFVTKTEVRATDPGFEPYAYRKGMYKRVPYWSEDETALRTYWQPYLEGKQQRQTALERLAHAIVVRKKNSNKK